MTKERKPPTMPDPSAHVVQVSEGLKQPSISVEVTNTGGEVEKDPLSMAMGKVEVSRGYSKTQPNAFQERLLEVFCQGVETGIAYLSGEVTEDDLHKDVLRRSGMSEVWERLEAMGVVLDSDKWEGWWKVNRMRRSTPKVLLGSSSTTE